MKHKAKLQTFVTFYTHRSTLDNFLGNNKATHIADCHLLCCDVALYGDIMFL